MNNKLSYALSIFVLYLHVASCNESNLQYSENLTLKNTNWKLVNIVDNTNAVVRVPNPNADSCYLVSFDTDSTLRVHSSVNNLQGSYKLDLRTMKIKITNFGGTKINELYDGKLFMECLTASESFVIKEDSLILYYNDKDYLIFNAIDYDKE